jgi:hypothetical protein
VEHEAAPGAETLPSSHDEQLVEPKTALNIPALQSLHLLSPFFSA